MKKNSSRKYRKKWEKTPKNLNNRKKRCRFFDFRQNVSIFSLKLHFSAFSLGKKMETKTRRKGFVGKSSKKHTKFWNFRRKKILSARIFRDFWICRKFGSQSYIRRNAVIWLNKIKKFKKFLIVRFFFKTQFKQSNFMNILRFLFKDLKIWESYDISVLTQSIKPKHLFSFKLHEGKRETDCLTKITFAKE